MTVKELIEQLQQFPPDMEVRSSDSDYPSVPINRPRIRTIHYTGDWHTDWECYYELGELGKNEDPVSDDTCSEAMGRKVTHLKVVIL
jgi:hypothetical protein